MPISTTRTPLLALALVAPALLAAPCGGDLLDDASFDLWCGDELCGWALEAGSVEKVATWHSEDHGVGLVGETVILSQLADITEADASCVWLSLVADQEDAVDLTVSLDFMDDGTVDFEHRVTATGFERSTAQINAPEQYSGMRVRLLKEGGGEAVIAQIRAQATSPEDCAGDPLPTRGLSLGTECTDAEVCAGGHCTDTPILNSEDAEDSLLTCGSCATDADCGADEACTLGWQADSLFPGLECAPKGDKALGEACYGDAECGTGVCHERQCSECRSGEDCEDGDCARPLPPSATDEVLMPHMCPTGDRASGEACLNWWDCASEDCITEDFLALCDPDGQPCREDADCDWVDFGATCALVGTRDGTCR